MAKIIRTKRLILRPWTLADAPDCAALINDIEVSRWLTVVPHPYRVKDAQTYIRDFNPTNRFCIEIGGQVAGSISACREMGYWLGKTYWGNGYMSEVVRAVVDDWFKAGHGMLRSGYFVGNEASKRILSGVGFVPGHIQATGSLATGVELPLQNMTLSRADWQAQNA